MNNSNDTFFGGRAVMVHLRPKTAGEPGKMEEVFVRQFQLEQWKILLPLIDDEQALICKATEKNTEWLKTITGKSYNELFRIMREVNEEGFFPYATRQIERGMEALKLMPPDMVKAQMERSAALVKR